MDLTSKELEIMQLSADGLLAKEVAARLGTSEQMIKNLRSEILSKLECKTFAQAVATAIRQGVID